jgi:hypothetical protein
MQIKPITALSREEVADLARNAADNSVPLREAIEPFRDSELRSFFIREWFRRRQELVATAA